MQPPEGPPICTAFSSAPLGRPPPIWLNHFPEGTAHGHLHQTCVGDFPREGKHLGACAPLGTDPVELPGAPADDLRDVGQGLNVVDVGGLSPQAGNRREGRFGPGHAPPSLNGGHEGSFFSADKGSGSLFDLQIEVEAAAEDAAAQKAPFPGLPEGDLQTLDGQGILRPDVDVAFASSNGIAADNHTLDDSVGVTFQDTAVHERSGIALIRVADDVLLVAGRAAGELPLQARGKTGTPPAPQTRLFDFGNDLFRGHLGQGLGAGRVASCGDVIIYALRIDVAAVGQGDPVLLLEKVQLIIAGDAFQVKPSVGEVSNGQIGHDLPVQHVAGDDAGHVFDRDIAIGNPGATRQLHIQEGFLLTHADTAGLSHNHIQPAVFHFLDNRLKNLPGPRGNPAGTHAHYDPGFAPAVLRELLSQPVPQLPQLRHCTHTAATSLGAVFL